MSGLLLFALGAMAQFCGAQTEPAHEERVSTGLARQGEPWALSREVKPVVLAERRAGNPPKDSGTAYHAEPESPFTKHRFYDRFAKLELAAAGTLAATDSAITCRFLARGEREMNLPTQSCAGMVGFQLAFYGAGEGLSFLLHRTGHHKLERLPRLYLGSGNAYGIAFTARHGGI